MSQPQRRQRKQRRPRQARPRVRSQPKARKAARPPRPRPQSVVQSPGYMNPVYKEIAERWLNPFGNKIPGGPNTLARYPLPFRGADATDGGLVPCILTCRTTVQPGSGGSFVASWRWDKEGDIGIYVTSGTSATTPTTGSTTYIEGAATFKTMSMLSNVKKIIIDQRALKVNYVGAVQNRAGVLQWGYTTAVPAYDSAGVTYNSYDTYAGKFVNANKSFDAAEGCTVRYPMRTIEIDGSWASDSLSHATSYVYGASAATGDSWHENPFIYGTGFPASENVEIRGIMYVYLEMSRDGNCFPRVPPPVYSSQQLDAIETADNGQPKAVAGKSFGSFFEIAKKVARGVAKVMTTGVAIMEGAAKLVS